jgi:hypothetical protein
MENQEAMNSASRLVEKNANSHSRPSAQPKRRPFSSPPARIPPAARKTPRSANEWATRRRVKMPTPIVPHSETAALRKGKTRTAPCPKSIQFR